VENIEKGVITKNPWALFQTISFEKNRTVPLKTFEENVFEHKHF
jgi:hypothetical protein